MQNNATTFKISPDDKRREVYVTTTSSVPADDTITSTATSNCCSPSCSAVYRLPPKLYCSTTIAN